MAKTNELEYSTTASSNTDINSINTDEGWSPAVVNNAFRQLMAYRASAITRRVAKATASGPFTAAKSDHAQYWDFTGSTACTLALTAAATLTDGWTLYIRNSSTATLTIDPNSTETINGATTQVLAIGQEAQILCNGSNFFFVNRTGIITGQSADLASATTTDLSAVAGNYVKITGNTTITGFGTVDKGRVVFLEFTAALTLTHNATSLILPGAASMFTAAGDCAIMVSEGSGNWRCLGYQAAATSVFTSTPWTPTIAFGGASVGITYTQQTGRYYRIGNLVFVTFLVTLSAKGSSTGNATIGGLPATVSFASPLATVQNSGFTGLTGVVQAMFTGSGTTATLYQTSATGASNITDTSFTATTSINGSGWFAV